MSKLKKRINTEGEIPENFELLEEGVKGNALPMSTEDKAKTESGSYSRCRFSKQPDGRCLPIKKEVIEELDGLGNNYYIVSRAWFDEFHKIAEQNYNASIVSIVELTSLTNKAVKDKVHDHTVIYAPNLIRDLVSGERKTRLCDVNGNDLIEEINERMMCRKAENKIDAFEKLRKAGSTKWKQEAHIFEKLNPTPVPSVNIINGDINKIQENEDLADQELMRISPKIKEKVEIVNTEYSEVNDPENIDEFELHKTKEEYVKMAKKEMEIPVIVEKEDEEPDEDKENIEDVLASIRMR